MDRPLKKSETIEIRIPYETKLAFMTRCREDGVSVSAALRGFIGERLEAPPEMKSRPTSGRRMGLQMAAGLAAAIGMAATAVPSLAASVDRIGFSRLDADGDGGVSRAELARGATLEVRLQVGASGLEFDRAAVGPAGEEDRALFEVLVRARFAAMDRNADGRLSFREFRRR
jgi:hypothetical protein